jgi:membrane-bound serine protease (ClpP class)
MNTRMRAYLLIFMITFLGLGLFLPGQSVRGQDSGPSVLVMDVNGPVAPAMELYINRGIGYAEDNHFNLIIMQLNTPGGAIDSMTNIVEAIRNSSVPVAIYIAPNGAMAASAGTLITIAGHVSAMAPQTTIGAASPVDQNGGNIDSTEATKIKEVFKAQVRGMMVNRKPGAVLLAQDMIDNAHAVSSTEALNAGLIDFQVNSVPELISKLNGFHVVVMGQPQTLQLSDTQVVPFPQTLIEEALRFFTDPNLVFLFLSAGIWAIIIEVSNPGGWVAGFVGAVLLFLAMYGLGILPVNWTGLLFIGLAFLLFILDIKAPTHGALTLAGAASFIAGALILFNSVRIPGVPVISVPLVVGTGLFLAATFFVAVMIALRAQASPILTGHQTLVGKVGLIRQAVNPKGQIQVAGELWTVHMTDDEPPIEIGEHAQVVAIDGVTLRVKRIPYELPPVQEGSFSVPLLPAHEGVAESKPAPDPSPKREGE